MDNIDLLKSYYGDYLYDFVDNRIDSALTLFVQKSPDMYVQDERALALHDKIGRVPEFRTLLIQSIVDYTIDSTVNYFNLNLPYHAQDIVYKTKIEEFLALKNLENLAVHLGSKLEAEQKNGRH